MMIFSHTIVWSNHVINLQVHGVSDLFVRHHVAVVYLEINFVHDIFDIKFDRSSLRMITAECDKSIKIWKEDETATPETHPVV